MSTAPLELHVHVTVDTEAIAAALDAVGSHVSPESNPAVRVKELDGGAVLVVRNDVAQLLTEFGWDPPADTVNDSVEAD